MSRGKRYNNKRKLNIKKVFALCLIVIGIIAIAIYLIKFSDNSSSIFNKITSTKYFAVYHNGKYGVIDSLGNLIIDSSFDDMIIVPNNSKDIFICTYDSDYTNNTFKTSVINSKNEKIFTNYDLVLAIDNFDEQNNLWYEDEVLKVKKGDKWGLINYNGTELLSTEYNNIYSLKGVKNNIIIEKDGLLGLVNNKGTILINPEFKDIQSLKNSSSEYIVVSSDSKYGVINTSNNIILENKYDKIKNVCGNNYYVVLENNIWKIIQSDETIILENIFDDVKAFNQNSIIISKNNKYGIYNTYGEEIIPINYEDLDFCFSNNFIAKTNNKYGIINNQNQIMLSFDYMNLLYESKANLILGYKDEIYTDIIDSNLVIKTTGILSNFNTEDGYFKIKEVDNFKYYNFKLEETSVSTIFTSNNLFLSKKENKYGYVDKDNNLVVDYIYDDGTEQNEYGYVAVKKDGKWGSLDRTGNVVANTQYALDNNLLINFIGKWYLLPDLNMNCYSDK